MSDDNQAAYQAQSKAAFALLDQAITACTRLSGCDGVAVDAVLIVGIQHVDTDGDRLGHVEVYPRSGAQPSYITRGIIDEGLSLLKAIYDRGLGGMDDDDESPS